MNFLIIAFVTYLSFACPQPSPFGFKVQFIGKDRYVSSNVENSRNFCTSIQCLNDADILFTRSSQYSASDPCVDFANFTLGTAIDVGPPNDRDRERSFKRGIHIKMIDRVRRAFIEKKVEKQKMINHLKKCFKGKIHKLSWKLNFFSQN